MEKTISKFLSSKIGEGEFPSAVYLVAEKDEILCSGALGNAIAGPEPAPAELNTIYDLASLTKPLVTGLLCARLIEQGKISLSDRVSGYFAELDTADKKDITIRDLLTHTSGFRDWLPFYLLAEGENRKERLAGVMKTIGGSELQYENGGEVVYSDLNFIILGFLVERLFGATLDKVTEGEITGPLGLERTFFNPPVAFQRNIAASETGNGFEKAAAERSGFDVTRHVWRQARILGEVHDENCRFLGGVSGHAGLFSTAGETFIIAKQFIAESTELLRPETCAMFRENLTRNFDQAKSPGFQLAATEDSTAGRTLAPDSFGHLGFTGTSVWIEPGTQRVFILLTNRTHMRPPPFADLKSTRQRFHGLAAGCVSAEK